MKHLTLEQLNNYLEGQLVFFSSHRVKRHLNKCAKCSEACSRIKKENQLAKELKKSIEVLDTPNDFREDDSFICINHQLDSNG